MIRSTVQSSDYSSGFVRFGPFEVDLNERVLRKHGVRIKVQAQPFEVLVALLRNPGTSVTRDELRRRIWPEDTFVDFEHGLNAAVTRLRQALADSAERPRYIETLPKRGYRFIAPVSRIEVPGNGVLPVPESAVAGEPIPVTLNQHAVSETPSPAAVVSHRGAVAAIVALALAVAVVVWIARAWPNPVPRVAVLPFESLSGDATQGYLADGMTDQLIAELSHIRSLRVISRTSVTHYKGTRKRLTDIAVELNVGAIVEGSVTQSNGRIRVNVRLVRLPSEEAVWTRTYERDGSDILVLQGEMARNIGEQIGALITPEERRRMVSRARPVDPDLHALYLNGRFLALEPDRNIVDRGIGMLEKVVEKDPTHAPAYAALAEAWFQLANNHLAPSEAMPKAKTAARRAIGLDPELDDARATLGRIHLFYDWDWQAAEEQLEKALDLNPNSSAAYRGLGCLRMALGRADESLKAAEQGLRLSPMYLWTRFDLAMLLTLAGKNDEAIRQARRTLEWEPTFGLQRAILGVAHAEKGELDLAVRELEAAVKAQRIPATVSFLAHVYALVGRKPDAERLVAELESVAEHQYVCPYEVATALVTLGRSDDAFTWMKKGIAARADCMVWLHSEPWLKSMRRDTRYPALLREVGLPRP
jgi:TolB-like protein/DNA-binding winged helix-turn-helix (wHTH) protein/Flp pilus assembly protein TadD